MKYLKKTLVIFGALLIISCGNNSQNQTNLNQLKKDNDSLKKELLNSSSSVDTLLPVITVEKNASVEENDSNTKKSGKHPISLQWISWEQLGTVTIKPLDGEWYSIEGSQKNKSGDFLSIEGKIKRFSEKELIFDGTIITKVKHNNGGKPCIKKGIQTFYAKGERKYFRLQNMENCEGGMLVDYVDIYAGNSSL